jgi:hypothetical protein
LSHQTKAKDNCNYSDEDSSTEESDDTEMNQQKPFITPTKMNDKIIGSTKEKQRPTSNSHAFIIFLLILAIVFFIGSIVTLYPD